MPLTDAEWVRAGDKVEVEARGYPRTLHLWVSELPVERPEVRYTWEVRWGVVNDDIVLTNTSAVPLTNVTFTPRIESRGQVWEPALQCSRIEPGQTLIWRDAVSIPGSSYERATARLGCDQAPTKN